MKKITILSICTLTLIALNMSSYAHEAGHKEIKDDLQQWKETRIEKLKKPHGWLSLIGLEWLKVGKNKIGSGDKNDIKLPHGPESIGVFYLSKDNKITFNPSKGVAITDNKKPVTEKIDVFADTSDKETNVFSIDTFEFYVVERGNFALRIKDSLAKTRTEFNGIDYFPKSDKLDIKAKFTPYMPAKKVEIVNVLGLLSIEESPGKISFMLDGKEYSLDALDGGDDSYYMIFGDRTNGRTTYGPGRFLYTDGKVDSEGFVRIDFNKAYNPPCAFTEYSTCSLPPVQNRLSLFLEAGEKKYGNNKY